MTFINFSLMFEVKEFSDVCLPYALFCKLLISIAQFYGILFLICLEKDDMHILIVALKCFPVLYLCLGVMDVVM